MKKYSFLPDIIIDKDKMDYIEIGGGGSRRFQYIFCGIVILVLLFTKLLFASGLIIDDVKKELGGNPTKIAAWLKDNISYISDEVSYAQIAQETLDKHGGDCEDFAILAQYLIGDNHETYLIMWAGVYKGISEYYAETGEGLCHCICVVKYHNDVWGGIDIDRYIFGEATLVGIIQKSCDLAEGDIEKAYFVKRDERGRIKITGKIDLDDYYRVY